MALPQLNKEYWRCEWNIYLRTGFAILFIETLGWARFSMFVFHSFADTVVPLLTKFG